MPRTSTVQPTSYNISVVITGGANDRVNTVKAFNRSTREFAVEKSEKNQCSIDLANLSSTGDGSGAFSGFTNGDVIDVTVTGGSFGGTAHTVDTGANRGDRKSVV